MTPRDTATALLALAERVEALTGPCRETDESVHVAAGRTPWPNGACRPFGTGYTSSLDAAMTLVPDDYQQHWSVGTEWTDIGALAFVGNEEAKAATPALALTAAALRARAATIGDDA